MCKDQGIKIFHCKDCKPIIVKEGVLTIYFIAQSTSLRSDQIVLVDFLRLKCKLYNVLIILINKLQG